MEVVEDLEQDLDLELVMAEVTVPDLVPVQALVLLCKRRYICVIQLNFQNKRNQIE